MKKNIYYLFLGLFFVVGLKGNAQQKIGNNPTTINTSAVLDLESTNKGLLIPRLALTGTTVASPLAATVAGMVVYNTASTADVTPGFYFNDGAKWIKAADASTALALATSTSFGQIKLAGDLSGTAAVPTVANNAITSDKIFNSAVTGAKLENNISLPGTANMVLPSGTTAQRPATAAAGMARYNTTDNVLEYYNGTVWTRPNATVYSGSSSTVLNGSSFERAALTGDVTATQNSNALTISNLAINTAKLSDNAVTTAKIVDGTIATADVADGAITATKLNQMAATTGQVLKYNGTVWAPAADAGLTSTSVSNSITAGALTTTVNGIAATAVTLPVADGSETKVNAGANVTVTGAGTTASPYVVNAAGTTDATTTANGIVRLAGDLSGTAAAPAVANLAINTAKLSDNAVTTAKIVDGTIATADVADGAITATKLNQMAATTGQVLKYNGTVWAPAADAGLTSTSVSNSITAGALTTTVNGIAATAVTLPVADGSETKVNAGTNVTVTGSGTTASPYVVNSAIETATQTPSTAIVGSATQVAVASTNVQDALGDLATAVKTAGNNLYTADGTLSGSRVVNQGVNNLGFTSIATTGTNHFSVDGSTFSVDAVNNRVGIGLIAPVEKLSVSGGNIGIDYGSGIISNNTTHAKRNILTTTWDGTNDVLSLSAPGTSQSKIVFLTNASLGSLVERMTITSNGNIGIGTNSPLTRLNLVVSSNVASGLGNGDGIIIGDNSLTRFAQLRTADISKGEGWPSGGVLELLRSDSSSSIKLNSGGNSFLNLNSGNVGIGTSTITSKFQVSGSVAMSLRRVSVNTTLVDTDYTLLCDATIAGFTVFLPAANTCGNRMYVIRKTDTTANTITLGTAVKLSETTNITTITTNSSIKIQSDGTSWWLVEN